MEVLLVLIIGAALFSIVEHPIILAYIAGAVMLYYWYESIIQHHERVTKIRAGIDPDTNKPFEKTS
ncbi:MAG: hypothetical protein NTW79_02815 [Candidatus Berkelbacteria bacterium]|nr:hypothetical protein [Candidatus Berkelbacteria bacterium]